MTQYGFAYVTAQSPKEAQKIAQFCLSQKLAACVNIFHPVVSCYEWKGKYTEEKETVLILKTRQDLFSELCIAVKKQHSYDCPCVVFIPLLHGDRPFLSWMDSQLKKTIQ